MSNSIFRPVIIAAVLGTLILAKANAPAHWAQMVEEVTELEGEEQGQMLGDALPIGLRLAKAEG